MRRAPLLVLALALALAPVLTPALDAQAGAPLTDEEMVARAVSFILSKRESDGCFDRPAYVVEMLDAIGIDPAAWPPEGRSALECLALQRSEYGELYEWERLVFAMGSAGYDPRASPRGDAVAAVRAGFDGTTQFGEPLLVNDDVWAILALRAAGVVASDAMVQAAASYLELAQRPDGGWSHTFQGNVSDTDSTGMALVALRAADRDLATKGVAARQFLDAMRDAGTGGFYANPSVRLGGKPSAQSTVWAIHGHAALRAPEPPGSVDFLRARFDAARGGFATSAGAAATLWPTTEVAPILAGARWPLPGSAPASLLAAGHAGEATSLVLEGPFTDATWDFGDGTARGLAVSRTFDSAGARRVFVNATGETARFRGELEFTVRSARPTLPGLPPEVDALRNVPVRLDVSHATDPDGRVVRVGADWGDGARTSTTNGILEHEYALPSDHVVTVYAYDDAGGSSDAARVLVHVRNRAPLLDGVPARVIADRTRDVDVAPLVADPDGDAVSLSWRAGDASGEGRARFRPQTVGNVTVTFTARDAFGAEARASTLVEVVDLAPRILDVLVPHDAREGVPATLRVRAEDADGPTPRARWMLDGRIFEGVEVNVTLPAGTYAFLVEVVDAEGAASRAEGTLLVRAAGAPPAPVHERNASVAPASDPESPPPPPLQRPRFQLPASTPVAGITTQLALMPIEGANAYAFDFGDGTLTGWQAEARAVHAWARPGAFDLRAMARSADGRASSTSLVVLVAPPPAEVPPADEPRTEEPAVPAPRDLELTAAAAPPRQEVAGPAWATVLLALALAARRRRA